MGDFGDTADESRQRWEKNAAFWDGYMGDTSNHFHIHIVRPHTEELLDVKKGESVLDIACGNGNFSKRLAGAGAKVTAFDYCEKLIECAKIRCKKYLDDIEFIVIDAADPCQLDKLKSRAPFDKAVSNMAMMDIADIGHLFAAVFEMLKKGGIFVFSTHHPCFVKPDGVYMTPLVHEGIGICGQPELQLYYHRPLGILFEKCFAAGFVLDGFYEVTDDDTQIPVIIITRLRKP